ncbi:ROK family transcriptional regulator [Gemmobacter serpentinus]|uniref:ROK family transcriptional regulator n=1 Tax=Gemmobacter serpentinus TaxID=2652247 RepID=UPI00124DA021|nr:ROK family transcriptional regulator [Gemmobacter serpentinus]
MDDIAPLPASPHRIRFSNAVTVLDLLFRERRLSKAQLARRMQLNRSSLGDIAAELQAAGLLREVEAVDSLGDDGKRLRAGRPGIQLELVPDATCFLGAEIGVEHITTTMIDLAADVVCSRRTEFDGPATPVEAAVERAVRQALSDVAPEDLARCGGFGLSAPAQIDNAGRLLIAPLLGWGQVSLADLAQPHLPADLPIAVENDANAFAFGEGYKAGASRSGVTVFLLMESGVGGGIVIDGKLFRGGHGLAGEIGHMLLPGTNGRAVEREIGRDTLLARYRARPGNAAGSLSDLLRDLADHAPHAMTVADEWGRSLASLLTQVARVLDPNRIVLGGSVAALYPLIAARIDRFLAEAQAPQFPRPSIELDPNQSGGAAYGAACMLHRRFLSLENQRLNKGPADPQP